MGWPIWLTSVVAVITLPINLAVGIAAAWLIARFTFPGRKALLTTGKEAWTAKRKYISWASPALVVRDAGAMLLLNSERDVDAYDPAGGQLRWTVECLDGEVAPSPAYAGGVVFAANEYAAATALQLDPADAAPPTKAWEWTDVLPEVASPVGTDTHFYIASSGGEIICLDIKTGEEAWNHRFDEGFYSSPVLVGDCLYALDMAGVMHVFKAGATFEEVASIPFNEPGFATPAFLDGRIYLRAGDNLYCIAGDGS